jgi:predicted cupin superfamily sugar epimerase
MKARQDGSFPSHNVFSRFGRKVEVASALLNWCEDNAGWGDVGAICAPLVETAHRDNAPPSAEHEPDYGYVYLNFMLGGPRPRLNAASCRPFIASKLHTHCHMNPRDFIEHPEGGRFREVFRSDTVVTTSTGLSRSALTHIYFSLNQGEVSRFHKVSSDEIWNLYQGAGIRLYTWANSDTPPVCTELSAQANSFCHVVLAGTWQAAAPISDTVLVGC